MYVFFIRRFPDLDHMFPIIDTMAKRDAGAIRILSQNLDYDIRNDFILDFLKKEYGIRTEYSYHRDHSILRRLVMKILFSARRIYPRIGVRLFAMLQPFFYRRKWAEQLLDELNASVLIIDFQRASKYSTGILTEVAQRKEIPVIMISHAVPMNMSISQEFTLPYADYKVFPNRSTMAIYRSDIDSDPSVKILGSPRYCDEWEKINNSFLKKKFSCPDLPDEKGRLRVLFFERPRIGFNGDHDSVKAVKGLNFVSVVFQERLEKKNPFYRPEVENYPSARLVQWADVVVMSISSIALEVLWQDKPLIFMKYLAPDDECVFDQYGACWAVNSQDELLEALKTVHKDTGFRPYKRENVEVLFNDMVYAGDGSRDVLKEYADLIMNAPAGENRGG